MARPELLYPQRKRCRKCRSYFAFEIVDLKFCSFDCAGRDRISENPDDWPREHFVPRHKNGISEKRQKRIFDSVRQAERWAKRAGKVAYRCSYCNYWHIGSKKPEASRG